MTSIKKPLITIKGLHKSYIRKKEGKIDALKNVKLEISEGSFIELVGTS